MITTERSCHFGSATIYVVFGVFYQYSLVLNLSLHSVVYVQYKVQVQIDLRFPKLKYSNTIAFKKTLKIVLQICNGCKWMHCSRVARTDSKYLRNSVEGERRTSILRKVLVLQLKGLVSVDNGTFQVNEWLRNCRSGGLPSSMTNCPYYEILHN